MTDHYCTNYIDFGTSYSIDECSAESAKEEACKATGLFTYNSAQGSKKSCSCCTGGADILKASRNAKTGKVLPSKNGQKGYTLYKFKCQKYSKVLYGGKKCGHECKPNQKVSEDGEDCTTCDEYSRPIKGQSECGNTCKPNEVINKDGTCRKCGEYTKRQKDDDGNYSCGADECDKNEMLKKDGSCVECPKFMMVHSNKKKCFCKSPFIKSQVGNSCECPDGKSIFDEKCFTTKELKQKVFKAEPSWFYNNENKRTKALKATYEDEELGGGKLIPSVNSGESNLNTPFGFMLD